MNLGSKILIVDDNEDFRTVLSQLLREKGFIVYEAGNGEHALEYMDTVSPDMAIVDLDMPKMNGIDFSKMVKKKRPGFPIVMVTAYAQFYSSSEILSAGVDAFLQKPVDWDKILDLVQSF